MLFPIAVSAHNVSKGDAKFVQANQGAAIGPYMYLGAKHMVTGYDHLLFLVGVIFFLYRLKDVFLYVSLFTLGHSITLLGGVLGGIHANPYLVDAVIGLSVVYKAFDNMDGFKLLFGFQPNTQTCCSDLRFVPWLRPGDEASGIYAVEGWAGRKHRELQRWNRNRAGPRLDGRAHWVELLANA